MPEPIRVVPTGDSHCLTEAPEDPPAIIRVLSVFPPGVAATRDQQDQLADAYIEIYKYATRAWRDCGTHKK